MILGLTIAQFTALHVAISLIAIAAGLIALPAFARGRILPRTCLLYTSPSPRDKRQSRMPSSA